MKNVYLVLALVIAIVALPLAATAKISLTGNATVSAQDVDFDNTPTAGSTNADEDWSFNDARVNLYINGDVSDNISANVDVWISNDWTHENSNAAGVGNVTNAATTVEVVAANITVKDVGGSGFDLTAGIFAIPFGFEAANRTANGDDSRNDFITNSLTDNNGYDAGLQLNGSFDAGSTATPLSWTLALMNGEAQPDGTAVGATTNKDNDDFSWAVSAEVGVVENLTVAASYYTNDQSKDAGADPMVSGNTLLRNSLTAGGNLTGLSNVVGGYDRDMWEVSADYDYGQGNILGYYGNIEADTTTTNGNLEFDYWGVQGRYNVDDGMYIAARYNRLEPSHAAAHNNHGEPDMWSVAGGYMLADNATLKIEYTDFNEDGNAFGTGTNTVDAISDDADALTISLGVAF